MYLWLQHIYMGGYGLKNACQIHWIHECIICHNTAWCDKPSPAFPKFWVTTDNVWLRNYAL